MPRCRQFVVCSGLLLLVASSTLAQWQRILINGKGERIDVPFTHPLSYFTANPYLRDDGGDLCCGPGGLEESEQKYVIGTEVARLGTVAGFSIVQILFRVGPRGESEPAKVRWKFLLVQTGKGLYREIYHLQAYYIVPPLQSAEIVKVGDEEILATNDGDGGNGGDELGARGIGEIGLTGIAAAITAAVHHATGVRVRELPVKIENLIA